MRRRDFLDHVGWTGAGILYTVTAGGVVSSPAMAAQNVAGAKFSFLQISDSHIGFHQPANEDVAGTLSKTVNAINALDQQPTFVFHTGDVTHLSKQDQFDQAKSILGTLKAKYMAIPGEHDVIGDNGKGFLATFGSKDAPDGWFSFDMNGVHFVALVNVFNFEKMGLLGQNQIDWLAKDLKGVKNDTPIVVFGHVPLYAVYEPWGWLTEDSAKALAQLSRFSSVTVLNGHIHQVLQHTEGNMKFYTASATAYPQPAPGTADKPGPLVVPPDQLLHVLGYRSIELMGPKATVEQHALG